MSAPSNKQAFAKFKLPAPKVLTMKRPFFPDDDEEEAGEAAVPAKNSASARKWNEQNEAGPSAPFQPSQRSLTPPFNSRIGDGGAGLTKEKRQPGQPELFHQKAESPPCSQSSSSFQGGSLEGNPAIKFHISPHLPAVVTNQKQQQPTQPQQQQGVFLAPRKRLSQSPQLSHHSTSSGSGTASPLPAGISKAKRKKRKKVHQQLQQQAAPETHEHQMETKGPLPPLAAKAGSPKRKGETDAPPSSVVGSFIRPRLPIDTVRERIVELLRCSTHKHPTLIFIGEAGCGKSTQIPQMAIDAAATPRGSKEGPRGEKKSPQLIAVTEPRKVAALSLAKRVARERGCEVGTEVGYKFRFESKVDPDQTKLVYMTDGILLREALFDQLLSGYSTVFVDEVHERGMHTDELLFVLKLVQARRLRENERVLQKRQQRKEKMQKEGEKGEKPQHSGEGGGVVAEEILYKPLRIVLMSATLKGEKFSEYFDNAPMYYVKGRMFPVELYYAEEESLKSNDHLHNAICTVMQLHESEPIDSGFLVFLTGQEEIEAAVRAVKDAADAAGRNRGPSGPSTSFQAASQQHRSAPPPPIHAISLYSTISSQVEKHVFGAPRVGRRKVVFATNIAETSLTIPGIRVVIDSGKVKQRSFIANSRVDTLHVVDISKEQANQRAGRAGREAPGKCYRLYSNADYDAMKDETVPELLRINPVSAILDLASMGMRRINKFRPIDKPDESRLAAAVEELSRLGALISHKNGRIIEITETGQQLSRFPVEPTHALILIAAASSKLHCLEEALTVVAFLTSEPVFRNTADEAEQKGGNEDGEGGEKMISVTTSKREGVNGNMEHKKNILSEQFYSSEGDHVRYVKIYRAYRSMLAAAEKQRDAPTKQQDPTEALPGTTVASTKKMATLAQSSVIEWCRSNGLLQQRLEAVLRVRSQLEQTFRETKILHNLSSSLNSTSNSPPADGKISSSCGNNFTLLRKAICYGLFQNACRYDNQAAGGSRGGYRFAFPQATTPQHRLQQNSLASTSSTSSTATTPMTLVKIHPSSCLARTHGAIIPWFVFTELLETSAIYARDICPVEREWVEEIWEKSRQHQKGEEDGNKRKENLDNGRQSQEGRKKKKKKRESNNLDNSQISTGGVEQSGE